MKKRLAALLLVSAFTASSLTDCIEVVKVGEEGKLTGKAAFNADSGVESTWRSKAVSELMEKAVDLNAFLMEFKGDLKTPADKCGKYPMRISGELSYMVKGAAEMVKVDQTKKAGVMDVKFQGYDGPGTIQLQTGLVFKSSAVCDSLNFIKYEDYKNQVQWVNVFQNIHTVIQKQVLDPLNVSSLIGKAVELIGCFTVNGSDKLPITPVRMTVK